MIHECLPAAAAPLPAEAERAGAGAYCVGLLRSMLTLDMVAIETRPLVADAVRRFDLASGAG